MARKPTKSPKSPSTKAPSPKSTKSTQSTEPTKPAELGLSNLRLRLNFLEQENAKLLKQIEKNRTELSNLTEGIRELGIQIAQRTAPMMQKFQEIDRQIHEVFEQILTGRKLGKQSRKNIESVYYHLQIDGVISFNPRAQDEMEEDEFEFDPTDDEDDWHDYYHHQRSQRDLEQEAAKPDREELKKIRQLFLRLAETFHPDKATEEADKEYNTEVMKEINQAYQAGDLAKLLAIEKQQELGELINRDSTDDLTRQCAKVEAENEFLKNQCETIKKELRFTKNTQQGLMISEYKKLTKAGVDPVAEALDGLEHQIKVVTELHQFVSDFRDRRITIKEFLKGPTSLMPPDLINEEMLLELLANIKHRS